MHEYAESSDLRSRHAQWHASQGRHRVWDQPPSHLSYADFTQEALVRMVTSGDPAVVRAAADQWGRFGTGLSGRAQEVRASLKKVKESWQGQAVQQFVVMVDRLVESLEEGTATAWELRDLLLADADLLSQAQSLMSGTTTTT